MSTPSNVNLPPSAYRGIDRVNAALCRWVSIGTLIMVLLTFLIVVFRYGFQMGWIALQESVMYLHALVFMVGIAHTLRGGWSRSRGCGVQKNVASKAGLGKPDRNTYFSDPGLCHGDSDQFSLCGKVLGIARIFSGGGRVAAGVFAQIAHSAFCQPHPFAGTQ